MIMKYFQTILLCAVTTAPATAQYTPLINPLVRTTIPQVIQCPGCNKAQAQKQDEPRAQPARPSAVSIAALRFTPNPAVRKTVVAQFASNSQAAGNGTPLGRFLSTGDPIAGIDKQMVALGLSPSNLADVMAMFVVNQWSFAHGIAAAPSRTVVQAVKAQMVRAVLVQPGLAQMTSAAKQQQADSMMILMAVMTKASEEAASFPRVTQDLATAATKTLTGMGFDLDVIELGPNGLGPVRR